MIWGLLIWLAVCAWEDVRKREVPNGLTLPMLAGMMVWRIFHPDAGAFMLAGVIFVMGLFGLLPGGDAKGLIALALFSPELSVLALLMAGVVWLGYRLFRHRKAPGFAGFLTGAILYLALRR